MFQFIFHLCNCVTIGYIFLLIIGEIKKEMFSIFDSRKYDSVKLEYSWGSFSGHVR